MENQEIKVGDMVKFFWTGTSSALLGQVISLYDEMCDVFVEKNNCLYTIEISRVKKI